MGAPCLRINLLIGRGSLYALDMERTLRDFVGLKSESKLFLNCSKHG